MSTLIELHLQLHVGDVTAEAETEARAHAAHAGDLGIDEYVAEAVEGAPFGRIVAHLLMFDPAWLFLRPWVHGWVVTPEEES